MRSDRPELSARHLVQAGLCLLACIASIPGCSGVTVTSLAPTPLEKVTTGDPGLLNFVGSLADGGSFQGFMLFGSRDIDSRPQFGRFQARDWDVWVTGGTLTGDAHFSNYLGGRALLETYDAGYPVIGLIFLWPGQDPTVQSLSPHFYGAPGYSPDMPPAVEDFGSLLPGSLVDHYGVFKDGQGNETVVSGVNFVRQALPPTSPKALLPAQPHWIAAR